MRQNNRQCFSHRDSSTWDRMWKRMVLVVMGAALMIGLMGCSLDDILTPFDSGEIPFEQGETAPTDMGAVDNPLTVPDNRFADGDLDII